MNDVIIVIPAYNEEKNICHVIQSIKQLHLPVDIAVVDDGSRDQTAKLVKAEKVHLISHPTNLGYISSIKTGFRFAQKNQYQYCILFDGDGQHDAVYIEKMIEKIKEENTDVVIGSRFLMSSSMNVQFTKLTAIRFFRYIIKRVTGTKITDPTSGFRAFNSKVFTQLADSKHFNYDLPDSNFIIDILLQKLIVKEIPVNMYDRMEGESQIHANGLKPLIYMAQTLLSIFVVILKNKVARAGGSQ